MSSGSHRGGSVSGRHHGSDVSPSTSDAVAKRRFLAGALFALAASVALASTIGALQSRMPGDPSFRVGATTALLIVLAASVLGLLWLRQEEVRAPETFVLTALALSGVVLAACYLYAAWFEIRFPADVLIWSESDFVNDVIKLRREYPLYTEQANNESFTYMPGAQALTYAIAALAGRLDSIATFRAIQLSYVGLAVLVACLCVFRLNALLAARSAMARPALWGGLAATALFLVATNPVTNPFVHNLHNDALNLLVSVVAFWVLIGYGATRDRAWLALMVAVPAAGLLVKQSSVLWIAVYAGYVALLDHPGRWRRAIGVAAGGVLLIGFVLGAAYLRWGEHFVYWTFEVLASHGVSPLRSIRHALDGWYFFAIGLLGGLALFRLEKTRVTAGIWAAWMALLAAGTYTSGIAWMRNHMGPGSLLAAVLAIAGLVSFWSVVTSPGAGEDERVSWLRASVAGLVVLLSFGAFDGVRVPSRSVPDDAYRYVEEIEAQFEGEPADRVLLDFGSWVYLEEGVVMKDRAPSIGERGYSRTGDFSGILDRIRSTHYRKILVRNLDAPDFWYDYWLWSRSSGIRDALRRHYREVGRIRAVDVGDPTGRVRYGFETVSVLVPRVEPAPDSEAS